MKLHRLRISNFQSFGPIPSEITLSDLTFLIGPNGSGKTAALQAFCRLFAFDPNLRRVQRSDFHIPLDETPETTPLERSFWIEAEFIFPELQQEAGEFATIPPNFAHMRLDDGQTVPRVRFRLNAKLDADGNIDDVLNYILDVDSDDLPLTQHPVPREDRNNIQVHYLPARRDPSDHITYTANSLLGRALRAANWQTERAAIKDLTIQISSALVGNNAVSLLGAELSAQWHHLHKGTFFSSPQVTFVNSEIEALLRHLSVSFSPAHGENHVDFSRLSDGQKSMLYLSLVLSMQRIGRAVLNGEDESFDVEKLKPAVFTLIAMEEPENSLSPHYLGRVVQSLKQLGSQEDAQALVATHAPSMLKRIAPESIRYFRLNALRNTQVSKILLPSEEDANKYVREAVQAFPEMYFSRLIVLGEGDSEEIVLPRLFQAKGLGTDESAISVVPLGGRHVNHFWRLLNDLDIPFITLLDLDLARHQGGWGRIRYVVKQLIKFPPVGCTLNLEDYKNLPKWNDEDDLIDENGDGNWISRLESHGVFFSSPMDLDFAFIKKFPTAYGVNEEDLILPVESKIKAVLGDSYHNADLYFEDEKKLFNSYHRIFKLGSKPSAHLNALSSLNDVDLSSHMPLSLNRLIDVLVTKLDGLPE